MKVKEQELQRDMRKLEGSEYIFHLDGGNCFTGVHMHQTHALNTCIKHMHQTHQTVHFIWFILCKLYLNKPVFKMSFQIILCDGEIRRNPSSSLVYG